MGIEERARELVDHLQTVFWEVRKASQSNPEICKVLSPQEIRAVMTVGRRGGCAIGEIAEAIQLSVSSATGIVDKLEEKKLVARERAAEDRRVVRVALTRQGREMYDIAMDCHAQLARGMLKSLSAEEQDALLALFRKIGVRLSAGKAAV